jgi:uncharacterized membrane protein YpjA
MLLWKLFINWLGMRSTLWLVLFINVFGTIYGYIWYKNQLAETKWWLWPLVPDSPTASLFFCFALISLITLKRWLTIEAFAAITLFKYGIWATLMICWAGLLGGELNWQHYMLIFSHLGMAVQALLYSTYFTFKFKHLGIVALWMITNDVLDYTLGIYPWLDSRLENYLSSVYFITISLSLVTITIFYFVIVRRQRT